MLITVERKANHAAEDSTFSEDKNIGKSQHHSSGNQRIQGSCRCTPMKPSFDNSDDPFRRIRTKYRFTGKERIKIPHGYPIHKALK